MAALSRGYAITYACMSKRQWDGASYDRVSGPMARMGLAVLERLELAGGETVLDAGCGSGRITEALLERLPEGRVIAVDASPSMIAAARERLAGPGGVLPAGLQLRTLDLLELDLEEPLDAILSTATFHWIADHDALFLRLRGALRPGGRLVAQCGGAGNITRLRGAVAPLTRTPPYAEHFESFQAPWNYASAEDSERRLLAAGFSSARCWLAEAPQRPEHPREFLSTVVLGPHVQQLPPELREPFMDEVMALLAEPVTVDYVRLNIDAVA